MSITIQRATRVNRSPINKTYIVQFQDHAGYWRVVQNCLTIRAARPVKATWKKQHPWERVRILKVIEQEVN